MAGILQLDRPMKPPFNSVDIRLSYDEALVLWDIMRKCGGAPKESRREHCDSICDALHKVIEKPHNTGLEGPYAMVVAAKDITGNITFLKEDEL